MRAESWREVWRAIPLYVRVIILILTFILLPLVALTLYHYGFEGFLEPGILGSVGVYMVAVGSNIGSASSRLGLKKQKYFAYALACVGDALAILALLRRLGLI